MGVATRTSLPYVEVRGFTAASIQRAIDIATPFSEIIFPKGTYLIGSAGISLSGRSNLILRGMGAKLVPTGASALSIGSSVAMILLDACTNVKVTDLEIDNDSIAHIPIGLHDCAECELSHNKIYEGNSTAHVFSLNGVRNRYLYNRISDGTGITRGMWIGNAGDEREEYPLIQGNVVRDTPHTGITGHTAGGVINSNHVIGTGQAGINMGGGTGPDTDNTLRLVISSNVVRGCGGNGIHSDTSGGLNQQIAIVGNICEENAESGIGVTNIYDSVIANNICRDNNADASGSGNGIHCAVGKRVLITGNLCYDSRSGASRTQNHGIRLNANTVALCLEDISVTGNVCRNNLNEGITLSNTGSATVSGVSFQGNSCVDNGGTGLSIVDAAPGDITEISVVGNHLAGNAVSDIRIDPPDTVICGNRYSTNPSGLEHTFTDQDATPSVKGRRNFIAANTVATGINAFDEGVVGQEISVRTTNGNTTINNTSAIKTTGAANILLTTDSTITFRNKGSNVWVEVSRSIK